MSEELWAGFWFTVSTALVFSILMFLMWFKLSPLLSLFGLLTSTFGLWISIDGLIRSIRRLIRHELEERTKGTE